MKVKLSDIAHATGYSINTISRALRDDQKLNSETIELIKKKAAELGYIRNYVAGSMRSNKTNTIGVISADSSNPFFAEVLLGIEDEARKRNHHILLINTEEKAENEYEAVKLLQGRQVDGIIVIPVFESLRNRLMYESLSIPYVFAGRRVKGLENHSILHGDITGAEKVFEYFIQRGHRKILYLTGPDMVSNTHDRLKGMHIAYEKAGLAIDNDYLIQTQGHIDDGYISVNHALNRGLEFTAIACFNDLIAMGCLKSLHENGLKVPNDVEVFGYDNLNMAQYMQPRLSSVEVPKAKLGQKAVDMLVDYIEGTNTDYKTVQLAPRLIFRETTIE